ncbi:MAG: helical backbone metal receptor [Vicinamibacterales bacterium]
MPGNRSGLSIGLLTLVVLCGASETARAQVPSRIVSTSPSTTEVLFALGLGSRVVGVSTYCRYPEATTSLPKVGTFLRPSTELIARLRPDLAIVSQGANDVPRQLSLLGIRSVTIEEARSLDSVRSMIREIGRATGSAERADALVSDIQARLDRVRASVRGGPRTRVLVVVGRSPGSLTDLVVVGRGSYLSDLVGVAGGVNVLDDPALPSYPRISMETVIRLDPDVIVDAGDMGDTVAEHVRRQSVTEGLWRRQASVAAARRGAVHAVTSDAFVVPGPRVVEAAETLAAWLRDAGRR